MHIEDIYTLTAKIWVSEHKHSVDGVFAKEQ